MRTVLMSAYWGNVRCQRASSPDPESKQHPQKRNVTPVPMWCCQPRPHPSPPLLL